ncbi:uncharacterized protein KY384_006879 [Bacidia gigantensis]|uniref:uncharacterized protein n=1 Tax=Bacidia gigantensis TaxID=2732470 RepID=UPI001D04B3F4|nr:uncharacterized protein KY384_006879 [Bacidia gigantensis]KAG8527963.1 hypothetical protein KY384_006879 [Bacidia gigantensis]
MTSTTSPSSKMPPLSTLLNALHAFKSSPRTFQILHTVGSVPSAALQTLYILDSSFNPPTLAHSRICTSALLQDPLLNVGQGHGSRSRLLLLLATQNADKPPKPAGFEQRVGMMCVLAKDIRDQVGEMTGRGRQGMRRMDDRDDNQGEEEDRDLLSIDVGVVKTPLFIDKVKAVTESGVYHSKSDEERQPSQVHLIGFDTLIRLLEPSYYPDKTLKPLEELFGKHKVRVSRRIEDAWGAGEEQGKFVRALEEGSKEEHGFQPEWVEKIELVEGRGMDEEAISSTRVRDAVREGEEKILQKLITGPVGQWIKDEGLYKNRG